jgi:hypothetical protein
VEPIPDGRVLFFVDLRPDRIYVTRDHNDGEEREVVACAIVEFPTVRYVMPLDGSPRALVSAEMDALIESGAAGEGEAVLAYCVVELEAHGEVVEDWVVNGLDDAKEIIETNILESRPGPVLEELPPDREDALSLIHHRLSDDK